MSEFYEPNLFLSTPEHPNTMGVMLKLTETVDVDILRDVVEHYHSRTGKDHLRYDTGNIPGESIYFKERTLSLRQQENPRRSMGRHLRWDYLQ